MKSEFVRMCDEETMDLFKEIWWYVRGWSKENQGKDQSEWEWLYVHPILNSIVSFHDSVAFGPLVCPGTHFLPIFIHSDSFYCPDFWNYLKKMFLFWFNLGSLAFISCDIRITHCHKVYIDSKHTKTLFLYRLSEWDGWQNYTAYCRTKRYWKISWGISANLSCPIFVLQIMIFLIRIEVF